MTSVNILLAALRWYVFFSISIVLIQKIKILHGFFDSEKDVASITQSFINVHSKIKTVNYERGENICIL